MHKPAILALADGTVLEGIAIGALGTSVGELVFNTSMTGYQEMLTDPSYAHQIITLTTAHVGNTGCNFEDYESNKIWASGLVVRECTFTPSNYRAKQSLPEWLKQQGVVAIAGIDTRALTLKLREHGAIGACITTECDTPQLALQRAKSFKGLSGADLSIEVSRQTIERWDEDRGAWGSTSVIKPCHVVAYDFGIKHQILRILQEKGCQITIVPAKTSVEEVLSLEPHGIFLSNGPGDPQACTHAIEAAARFLSLNIPVFGICLGFQILALASGGQTKKMKFGHHGANHPVTEVSGKKRVFITSQNHGFEVDEATLPKEWTVTHRSLFDNSLQGIRHCKKPALGFQGHPESSPGPHDVEILFDEFIKLMVD